MKPSKNQGKSVEKQVKAAQVTQTPAAVETEDPDSTIEEEDTTGEEVVEAGEVVVSPKATSEEVKAMADKILAMIAEGKSLPEALAATLPTAKPQRIQIDRVAYINSLDNLKDLKAARKTAYAKKSKAKGKPEAEARYQKEIDTATARYNEYVSEVNNSACPWKKSIELGVGVEGALQYFVQDLEHKTNDELEELVKALKPVPTKAQVKTFVTQSKPTLNFVPDELKAGFQKRLETRDQRVYTLAQRARAVADLKSGARKFEAPPAKETASEAPKFEAK